MSGFIILAKEVPSATVTKFLLGPVYTDITNSVQEYKAQHQQAFNIIHVLVIIFSMLVGGIILPLCSPAYRTVLAELGPLMGETNTTDIPNTATAGVGNFYYGYLLMTYPASWVSYGLFTTYNICRYGDKEFFLDPKRIQQLAAYLGEDEDRISGVFSQLLTQLRAKHTALGASEVDLTTLLKSFMHDAPADVLGKYTAHQITFNTFLDTIEDTAGQAILKKYKRTPLGTNAPGQGTTAYGTANLLTPIIPSANTKTLQPS